MKQEISVLERENSEFRRENAELKKSLKRYRSHVNELNSNNAYQMRSQFSKNIEVGDDVERTPLSRPSPKKPSSSHTAHR